MNTTNQSPVATLLDTNATFVGRIFHHFGHDSSVSMRLMLIIVLAVLVHLVVKVIRCFSEWLIDKGSTQKSPLDFVTQQPKFVTLIQLIANSVTFIMYFFALGLVLQESLNLNLKEYLASASIIGLAVSFGSQGLVQDVVICLTLIFSDAMDVGDLVEIVCSNTVIGRVEEIGMRFTTVRNFFNQVVFIPNRTINNVSRFPHGGIYAYADVQIPAGASQDKAVASIANVTRGIWGQFGAIILIEPVIAPLETADGGGWNFVRVHFKIWPGQGSLIETTFRQQMTSKMKEFYPDYADWQVSVTYRTVATTRKI